MSHTPQTGLYDFLATSSPGRFSLALEEEKHPGDEVNFLAQVIAVSRNVFLDNRPPLSRDAHIFIFLSAV